MRSNLGPTLVILCGEKTREVLEQIAGHLDFARFVFLYACDYVNVSATAATCRRCEDAGSEFFVCMHPHLPFILAEEEFAAKGLEAATLCRHFTAQGQACIDTSCSIYTYTGSKGPIFI